MNKIKRQAVAWVKVFTKYLAGKIIIKQVWNPYRSGRKKKKPLQNKGKTGKVCELKIYRKQI